MPHTAMDTAILESKGFLPAIHKLSRMVSEARGIAILEGFQRYLKSLPNEGRTVDNTLTAPIVIALRHATIGAPNFISDDLFDAWERSNDGVSVECANDACRYVQPKGYSVSCVVCGAAVAEPGLFWATSSLSEAQMKELRLLYSSIVTLANQVSHDRRERLLREVDSNFLKIVAGVPVSPASIAVQAAVAISHQYLAVRTPLVLTNQLFDEWAAAAHTGTAECVQCGYRMPETHAACVLCGSAAGTPGNFKAARERRSKAAGWN